MGYICTILCIGNKSFLNTLYSFMQRLKLDEDILPLSEFRANAASMIEKIKEDHRPLVITQHGKSSAVIMDVSDYEQLIETIELLQEVNQAREQLEEGKGIDHEEVMGSIKEHLKQSK